MIPVDTGQVCAFLDAMGKRSGLREPDDILAEKIDICIKKMQEVVKPGQVYKYFPLSFEDGKIHVADMVIESSNLMKNLQGCSRCCLLAVTAGPGADRLRQRAAATSAVDASIYQAVGAAMVEGLADSLNEEINRYAQNEGMKTHTRFSPGYGDFKLEHQLDFARLLNMYQAIGVTVTDSYLLAPTKSITAIIGMEPV